MPFLGSICALVIWMPWKLTPMSVITEKATVMHQVDDSGWKHPLDLSGTFSPPLGTENGADASGSLVNLGATA